MVAHVFLFSDMLLITKTRGTDKYVIIKPVSTAASSVAHCANIYIIIIVAFQDITASSSSQRIRFGIVNVTKCVYTCLYIATGTITCIVLNDYQVLTDMFILKAHSADVAQEWADQIAAAQVYSQYSTCTPISIISFLLIYMYTTCTLFTYR